MKSTIERIKTALIIILAMSSLYLGYAYKVVDESITYFTDFYLTDIDRSRLNDFKSKMLNIQRLENNEAEAVRYSLYHSAMFDIKHIEKHSLKGISSDEIESFRNRYTHFMKQECGNNNDHACLRYGDVLSEQSLYDLAHSAYLKAAESGNLHAMSRLVYLYQNQEWADWSTELSKEWLMKLEIQMEVREEGECSSGS
ncbi:hypothetical protein [Marinimicrobium sp. ABcell2]|uniref:hypothetical protein n=1 Tax=Marinimicrobium sp. ABcell2 TaxID=3069751 RepID=UPI0027B7623C|nr:hypothetical protein [Marinimicrobium sp. ABcell2]MDQ2075157.1 hypothetical protein [Marinimicrobium sp. ABcell2]